jgi:hypothetical protein
MSKKKTIVTSDVPGAVIIHRDTKHFDSRCVFVTPASVGIKVYSGCVEFGPGDSCHTSRYHRKTGQKNRSILMMTPKECKTIYLDAPAKEEAWIVTPTAKGYDWNPITLDMPTKGDRLSFSQH